MITCIHLHHFIFKYSNSFYNADTLLPSGHDDGNIFINIIYSYILRILETYDTLGHVACVKGTESWSLIML